MSKLRKTVPNFISNNSWEMKKVIIFIVYPVALVFLIPYALKIDWGLPVAEWIGVFGIIFFFENFCRRF